ncbi:hypothetical protein STCU_10605 [Strigomonas culicis]|uniref:Uncharacterized protein n=1 Tax=Strigomonas culicis TaxID=28005 RepID=S9THA3_9TRYP|nr:hypothetical protein STCU_10605 [Strigomonas culicis]|eukprot:EPY17447.1 hypothetical protein STCU_10605 [Strigomonas culicis]
MSTDVCVCPFHFLHLCVAPCVAGILWLRACVLTVCSYPSLLLFLLFSATVVMKNKSFFCLLLFASFFFFIPRSTSNSEPFCVTLRLLLFSCSAQHL